MLKFLFFIIVIYFLFRFLGRYILPWLIKRYIKKSQQKFYKQNPEADPGFQKKQKKKEGDVNIKTGKKKKHNQEKEELGEYVDYEEIDDD